jgi:hypothetical protein
MNKHIPIDTDLGILKGRDCIYLDNVSFQDGVNTLLLKGEINGNLCSSPQEGEFIPYTAIFRGVLALKMIELDSWNFKSESSFDKIENSIWIRELAGKVTPEHKHYLIQTYDEVFEVVCSEIEFNILNKASLPNKANSADAKSRAAD